MWARRIERDARERLEIDGPNIPMATLLRLLVEEFEVESAELPVRFCRVLRCRARRQKYEEQFRRCLTYIKNRNERYM